MDRFIKTLGILIILLFLLASGIDMTLDRLARSPRQNQLSIYGQSDTQLLLYTGDLNRFAELGKVDPNQMPRLLRRSRNSGQIPVVAQGGYNWL